MNPATQRPVGRKITQSNRCCTWPWSSSNTSWKLTFGDGAKRRQGSVPAGDVGKLREALAQAKQRLGLPADARVVSCYEAGRDGFWLHRSLVHPRQPVPTARPALRRARAAHRQARGAVGQEREAARPPSPNCSRRASSKSRRTSLTASARRASGCIAAGPTGPTRELKTSKSSTITDGNDNAQAQASNAGRTLA
jgi:hypothetical protein